MAVVKFDGRERGCGYPQEGGLYLVTVPLGAPCDRLPLEIPVCPTCGETVRFSRSMQQINALKLFGEHENCKDPKALRPCPACQPVEDPAGLMWVGDTYYSPSEFLKEGAEMGVSKRINTIPKFFKVGETWLFLAHKKACKAMAQTKKGDKLVPKAGIIVVCKPSKLLKVVKESDITDEKVKALEEKGMDILSVPDNDERFTTPFRPKKEREHPLDILTGGNGS